MSKIKICGMQTARDIDITNELMPDFVGFIMGEEEKFRRQIPPDKAYSFRERLNPLVKSVGVFVNEPIDFVADMCNNDIIDLVQLHGQEDDDYILRLSNIVPTPVIKAVHARTSQQIQQAQGLHCTYLLLDTAYKDKAGGGGKSFNWDIIPQRLEKPFFLAGGINAHNIQQAIQSFAPYCIDLSSSVETDGFKDREKVKEVIEKVRRV